LRKSFTRAYAGEPSSRVKDLVDLVVIANATKVDAERLREAIEEIFRQRADARRADRRACASETLGGSVAPARRRPAGG
jgi:hypothetical protein